MEYCVYRFFSSYLAPRVTAFPGYRCYQVGASIQPSPVCLKMRLEPNNMKTISLSISVLVKCWSCSCIVCICLYLTLGIFIVNVLCVAVCARNKMDTHPVVTDPVTQAMFPLVPGIVKGNI